jgi:HlyD family secretion protein
MWMFASIGLITSAGAGVATRSTHQSKPQVTTVAVTRGDLVQSISATGSLEAVTTVNVGSQVSGTVQTLFADFNDIVRKGQTLARLDPSLFQTQVEQAEANLVRAEADVERLNVTRDAARLALDRTTRLAEKRLVSDSELETAQVSFRVEAYPNETFEGKVAQVRLQAVVSQNVVTYATVIDVGNAALKLKPGMTATVSIEVARRDNALLVPNATLRIRPSATMLASLGVQASAAGAQAGGKALPCGGAEGCATIWRFDGSTLKSLAIRTGITNGTVTEIVGTTLAEGDPVVSAIAVSTTSAKTVTGATASTSSTGNPLLGASPPRPPGGMGGPR